MTDEEREYIDKVLAESKMNYLEVEKSEAVKDDSTEDTKEETEA